MLANTSNSVYPGPPTIEVPSREYKCWNGQGEGGGGGVLCNLGWLKNVYEGVAIAVYH